MDLNKLFKAMLVVLPIMAVSACSSTSESQTDASSTNGSTSSETASGVQTGGAAPVLSPAEQQRLKQEELRKENVIYFAFDNSTITPQYEEILKAHADYLVAHANVKVVIEGYTDDRGTPEYNIALGERRAKSVAKFLQSMGVSPSQMSIVSYGEEKPADTSGTEAGFAKNRRAILVY